MSTVDFIRNNMQNLCNSLSVAVEGLTQEQAHWRPLDEGNHIAFILWHYTRTVDNITRFVLQNRRPTVWVEGNWHERFGLDFRAQGTGMEREEAVGLSISDIPAFASYMNDVWKDADAYLSTLTDEDLETKYTIRPQGEMTLEQVLAGTLLTHGNQHLGEIWLLKGLQGLPGNPI
jgi:hypothetical protein